MGANSKVRLEQSSDLCVNPPERWRGSLQRHATKNRRDLGGFVMWFGIREIGDLAGQRWQALVAGGGAVAALWLLRFRLEVRAGHRRRERRIAEELAAYAALDVRPLAEDGGIELARRVSRLMAEKSVFRRAAMLIGSAEGRLTVSASFGMDESTVQSLNAWGEMIATERAGGESVRRGSEVRVGCRSFALVLGQRPRGWECQGAIVTPLWTTAGRMLGAFAVGADGLMSVRRSMLAQALGPLEVLACKVERAMENAALAERLMLAERHAGLGVLAGGMAHALSNPLTAVLGFAELIAETAGEVRVKEDAGIIVREALKMRQTVETLLEFGRPTGEIEATVDVAELVRELSGTCVEKLENRGVRLIVATEADVALVQGDRERLRHMMEHLLNNAAQAVARTGSAKDGVIRVSVSRDAGMVNLIVSDTGPGFAAPLKVFEPGGTTRNSSNGAGLGLSVCYAIVHEHGGEISAFNLHPQGAAVVVEVPEADIADKKYEGGAKGKAGSVSV
jgi:signal transduction histidine kinase